jgi:pimeloyl-ACP methyl ester carboxylesterase
VLLAHRRLRELVLAPFVADPSRVPYHAAWRMAASYGRATAYAATSTAMRGGHFADLRDVDVPVTLAFGARDRLIRPVRPAGRARVVMLRESGHIAMWDEPERVTQVILETTAAAEPARSATAAAR